MVRLGCAAAVGWCCILRFREDGRVSERDSKRKKIQQEEDKQIAALTSCEFSNSITNNYKLASSNFRCGFYPNCNAKRPKLMFGVHRIICMHRQGQPQGYCMLDHSI